MREERGSAGLAPFAALSLSPLILPPDNPVLRDYPRPLPRRDAAYEARFDRQTLAYDHWTQDGRLHLLTPRLLNLWKHLTPRPRRRTSLRWEHLSYALPGPEAVTLGARFDLTPGPALHGHFAGLRVLMAVSRNNALDWIADWARFHVAAQGSQAVLLFDNGSTDYRVDEIVARLAQVPGLVKALVVFAPFPYGPAHGRTAKLEVPARFFQTAMFNLARLRMLGQARSVLSVDIDEMVVPLGARSAHEAAETHWAGVAQLRGAWAYCAAPGGLRLQRDHDHRRAWASAAMPKWCVAPGRLAGHFPWTVHRIFGDLDRAFWAKDQSFVHCQQCSTGWKVPREGEREGLVADPGLRETWARYLG